MTILKTSIRGESETLNSMIQTQEEENSSVETLLQPETSLEKGILLAPEILKGLDWGTPRFGHPEGKVLYHVREVLDNIEQLNVDKLSRQKLRLITIVHDTFKYLEDKSKKRDWSKHHSVLARQFMEKFTEDQAVLDVIELHDEAYYAWRLIKLYNKEIEGKKKLEQLLNRLGDNLQLYYLFFKCDTQTGDKIQAPLKWFEKILESAKISS